MNLIFLKLKTVKKNCIMFNFLQAAASKTSKLKKSPYKFYKLEIFFFANFKNIYKLQKSQKHDFLIAK